MSREVYNVEPNESEPVKWDKVKRFFRRVSDRLDYATGDAGPSTHHNNLSMDGHKILDGPNSQAAAESTEFITKDYLRSQEAALLMNKQLKSGGLAPLNITNLIGTPANASKSIRIDVFANRGAAVSYEDELFAASDRNYVTWASDGVNWIYAFGTQTGTNAARVALTMAATDAGYRFITTDTFEEYYYTGAAWEFAAKAIDSPTFFVDSANNRVGINNTGPDYPLRIGSILGANAGFHVGSAGDEAKDLFCCIGPQDAGPAMNFGYAGFSFGRGAGFFNARPDVSAVAPNPSIRFMTVNSTRLMITNTGNVGINTTAPDGTLEVNLGTAGQFRLTYDDSTGSAANYAKMEVSSAGLLTVTTVDASAANGHIALLPDGNVGVGTSTPSAKLAINGGLHVGGDSDPNDNNALIDGTLEVVGLTKTTGGVHVGGSSDPGADNLTVDGAAVIVGQTTLATTLTGFAKLASGVVSAEANPTIGSFANATHDHTNAAGGGVLPSQIPVVSGADYGWTLSLPTSHPVLADAKECYSMNTNVGDGAMYLWRRVGSDIFFWKQHGTMTV